MSDNDLSLSSEVLDQLRECESRLDYEFQDKNLLYSALTHASGADHRLLSNERLEFLGDSILGAVICEELFRTQPTALEGELTRIKSIVVSRQTCARVSKRIDLEHLLFLGKGMASSPTIPTSVLSDVFEALVAAIYLDGGIEPARRFVLENMRHDIEVASKSGHGENYKSQLQQLAQRQFGSTPVYRVVDEKGPDHSKSFHVVAKVGDRIFDAAWGRNKKEAEQRAACNALESIDGADLSGTTTADTADTEVVATDAMPADSTQGSDHSLAGDTQNVESPTTGSPTAEPQTIESDDGKESP